MLENLGGFAAATGTKAAYGTAKGTVAGGIGAVVGGDGRPTPRELSLPAAVTMPPIVEVRQGR